MGFKGKVVNKKILRKSVIRQRELVSVFFIELWNLRIFHEEKMHWTVEAYVQILIRIKSKKIDFFYQIFENIYLVKLTKLLV